MQTLGIILTLYFYYRCVRVTHHLLGPLGNLNIQILHQRFFTAKSAGVTCVVDGAMRGCAIAISPIFGVPELTTVLIIHTCITAAGITTAVQRSIRGVL
jgi:hypothetical protein